MSRKNIVITIIAVILLVALTEYARMGKTARNNQPAVAMATVVTGHLVPPQSVLPTPSSLKKPNIKDQLAMGMVRRREGMEHPLIRQLIANPELITLATKEGMTPFLGDAKNKVALKKWAGRQADILAESSGFKFRGDGGAEVRIKNPDEIAFIIVTNGSGGLSIAEYKAATPSQDFGDSPAPVRTHLVKSKTSQTNFLGLPDNLQNNPLPDWEYLYYG